MNRRTNNLNTFALSGIRPIAVVAAWHAKAIKGANAYATSACMPSRMQKGAPNGGEIEIR